MRKMTVSTQFDLEKFQAIQFYAAKKDTTVEQELERFMAGLYEKYVPAQTREYIENKPQPEPRPRPERPPRSRTVPAEQEMEDDE